MGDLSLYSDYSDASVAGGVTILNEPTVEEIDRTFIRKAIEFIRTLPGANKDEISVQTNTSFPSRYVLKISNLPSMHLKDFDSLKTLAPRLRLIQVSLKENWIKIDMWKSGASARKTKRKFRPSTNRKWNLKSIGKQDHEMLKRVLNGFSNLPSCPCQFQVDVTDEPPTYYHLDIVSSDVINQKEVYDFQREFRAFVKNITFHFPSSSLRVTVEKASATAPAEKRRRLVFKRST